MEGQLKHYTGAEELVLSGILIQLVGFYMFFCFPFVFIIEVIGSQPGWLGRAVPRCAQGLEGQVLQERLLELAAGSKEIGPAVLTLFRELKRLHLVAQEAHGLSHLSWCLLVFILYL